MDGSYQEKLRAQQTKQAIRRKASTWISAPPPPAPTSDGGQSASLAKSPESPAVEPGTVGEVDRYETTALHELLTTPDTELRPQQPLTSGVPAGDDDIWSSIMAVPDTIKDDMDFILALPQLDELPMTASATASESQAGQHISPSDTALCAPQKQDEDGARPTLREADLLLCYFDNMQFLQLPFASSRDHRSWQFVIVSRSAVCYWATLSLSAYGLRQDETYFHSRALKKIGGGHDMAGSIASAGFQQALDGCFASLQLALLEARRGNPGVCRAHLLRAFTLYTLARDPEGTFLSLQDCHTTDTNTAALQFLAISLQWCNAMWSCSMRQAPVLPSGGPKCLLQMQKWQKPDGDFQSQIICCQDWVVTSIVQVAELDVWKRESAQAGSLSVMDLVNRANNIEHYLKQRLEQAKGACPWLYTARHLPSSVLHSAAQPVLTHYVTEVFATAALMYLHVIISGARRRVPEINIQVRDTISLLRCRFCAQTLLSLCWPLCVAGCLAEGDERLFVMNLAVSAAAEISSGVSAFDHAISIMQECWNAVDGCDDADVDWTWGMNNLDLQVIFL
ncbi:hypothetical protein E4U41_005426 [Claviceps citrina]|nr:hypothetical protein E4U41_005426 [Claviceps citrina]